VEEYEDDGEDEPMKRELRREVRLKDVLVPVDKVH